MYSHNVEVLNRETEGLRAVLEHFAVADRLSATERGAVGCAVWLRLLLLRSDWSLASRHDVA